MRKMLKLRQKFQSARPSVQFWVLLILMVLPSMVAFTATLILIHS